MREAVQTAGFDASAAGKRFRPLILFRAFPGRDSVHAFWCRQQREGIQTAELPGAGLREGIQTTNLLAAGLREGILLSRLAEIGLYEILFSHFFIN
ncbi:MAG: hypothetical protein WBP45_14225 [Daejeonella sp.]